MKYKDETQYEEELNINHPLPLLWKRLNQVKYLSFAAESKAELPSGWNGSGKAAVEVHHVSPKQYC